MSRRAAVARGLIGAATPLLAMGTSAGVTSALGDPRTDAVSPRSAWGGGLMVPRQANDLADFWAVCTHFTFDRYAERRDDIIRLIAAAGIRVVRDGWGSDFGGAAATSAAMVARGIRLAATNSPSDTGGVETESAVRAMVEAHASRLGPGLIAAEGWNEPGGWRYVVGDEALSDRVRNWQQWVFRAYRQTAPYGSIPVGGPSLADSNSAAKWGALDLSRFADRATSHDYPGNSYVLRDTDFDRFRANGRAMVGRDRIASTETGTSVGQLHAPFSVPDESAAGILVPRVQWEHFRRGWEMSASYEFMDEGADGGYESKFGLIDSDLRPKPAYTTIQNSLTLLHDPGPAFTPAPLPARMAGSATSIRSVLLQKRDATYWLAVWNQVQVWGGTAGRVRSPAQTVALAFDRARTVTIYDPHASKDPVSVVKGTSASVGVTEKIALVHIA